MSASAVLRRRLGNRLRELRLTAELSQEQVADRLGVARKTVERAENAVTVPGARDLARLVDLYGVDPDTREDLIDLGTKARKRGGWWNAYKDLLPGPYVQLEAEASMVRNYEPLLVPGLLQTEGYARTILATRSEMTPEDVERHIAARQTRQERVTSGELTLHAVIDEAVLHRIKARDAHEQLTHLTEMAACRNVSIRVLPFGTGPYPAAGFPFVVLRFPRRADPDLVMAEIMTEESYPDGAEEVAAYNAIFDELEETAWDDEDSLKKINTLVAQLTS